MTGRYLLPPLLRIDCGTRVMPLKGRWVGSDRDTRILRDLAAGSQLRVAPEVAPALANALFAVLKSLVIPFESVDAFVYASPFIQAECMAASRDRCLLHFSSSLIDLLDPDEFRFVVGHELGHLLLGHGARPAAVDEQSPELLMIRRRQEISADRIGLLACGRVDVGIRAMMKTVSGLGDRHLRYDVSTFLSQVASTDPHTLQRVAGTATHPGVLIRCRAILWLSMVDYAGMSQGSVSPERLGPINDRVGRDLSRFVDGRVKDELICAKRELLLWTLAFEVVQTGAFQRGHQRTIRELLGAEEAQRLREFFSATPVDETEDAVYERLKVARRALEELAPLSVDETVRESSELMAIHFRER